LAVRWYHWAATLFTLDLGVLYVWSAVGIPEDCGWNASAHAWRCGVLLDFLPYYWIVFLAVCAALAAVVVGGLRSSAKKAGKL
jgi:hypothetical protein